MNYKIDCPANNTNLSLNVSGKSVRQVAKELTSLVEILNAMSDHEEVTCGFVLELEDDEEFEKPFVTIDYEEWAMDDDELDDKDRLKSFWTNNIIWSYSQDGNKLTIRLDKDFCLWAKTDKPIDEFCKSMIKGEVQ